MPRDKRKTLRNRADKLYQSVGLKLNPICECCGKPATELHHFIPKSLSTALRYDLKNGISLCRSCHFRHHSRFDPAIYEQMTANKSAEWFEYIKANRNKIVKPTLSWYKSQIEKLTKQNL